MPFKDWQEIGKTLERFIIEGYYAVTLNFEEVPNWKLLIQYKKPPSCPSQYFFLGGRGKQIC